MGRHRLDITGVRSGRLVAIEPTDQRKNKKALWRCRCDCGNEVLVISTYIRVGDTRSCGCAALETNVRLAEFVKSNANNAGCWEWPGFRDKNGYGRANFNGKTTVAHRAVYQLTGGVIPEGMNLCHRCDNPPCCRPDHMFIGTQKDNCQDAKAKARHSHGERNGSAKLSEEAVREIRSSGLTQWGLADKFGVTQSAIWAVIHRRAWAHVQD